MKEAGYTRKRGVHGDITIECDRCHEDIEGYQDETCTAGFYVVTSGYKKYARPGEEIICDKCMWADPKYRADYGWTGGPF